MAIKLEVGKRYLFRGCIWNNIYDATVLEISPSGREVKLKFDSGNLVWRDREGLRLVEELR